MCGLLTVAPAFLVLLGLKKKRCEPSNAREKNNAHKQPIRTSPYEIDRGELIGRDPRKLTEAEVLDAGIELRVPTKAIRAMCLSCCSGQEAEVRKCVAINCPLWALRMTGMSRELRQALKAKAVLEKDEGDD